MRIGKPDAGFKFRILNIEFNWLLTGLVSPLGLACATPSSISRLPSLGGEALENYVLAGIKL